MLSLNTRMLLADCLRSLGDLTRHSEFIKTKLAETDLFSLQALLRELDVNDCESLGVAELTGAIAKPDIPKDYFAKVIAYYDKNNDGRLNFWELGELLLPSNNPVLKRRALDSTNSTLTMRVHERVNDVLMAEYETVKAMELWKEKLESTPDFNIMAAFLAIKGTCEACDEQALWHFFGKLEIAISEEEVQALAWRLDKNKDGLISYGDLIECFNGGRGKTPLKKTLQTTLMPDDSLLQDKYSSPLRTHSMSTLNLSRSSGFTSQKLCEYFRLMTVQSRTLELLLRDLLDRPDFNLDDVYRMLDPEDRGIVTITALKHFFEYLGIANLDDAMLLIPDSVDSNAFYSWFSNGSPELYAELRRRRPNQFEFSRRYDVFSSVTVEKLRAFFEGLLATERALKHAKRGLDRETTQVTFSELDIEKSGFLRHSALKEYLEYSGYILSDEEIACVLRKLDLDKDGKVSYSDFVDSLTS